VEIGLSVLHIIAHITLALLRLIIYFVQNIKHIHCVTPETPIPKLGRDFCSRASITDASYCSTGVVLSLVPHAKSLDFRECGGTTIYLPNLSNRDFHSAMDRKRKRKLIMSFGTDRDYLTDQHRRIEGVEH
jgi:hypothetical protein